jgi:hypothetical protein
MQSSFKPPYKKLKSHLTSFQPIQIHKSQNLDPPTHFTSIQPPYYQARISPSIHTSTSSQSSQYFSLHRTDKEQYSSTYHFILHNTILIYTRIPSHFPIAPNFSSPFHFLSATSTASSSPSPHPPFPPSNYPKETLTTTTTSRKTSQNEDNTTPPKTFIPKKEGERFDANARKLQNYTYTLQNCPLSYLSLRRGNLMSR